MTGLHASGTTFTSTAYANMVTLPDGSELPPGPISFTQSDGADAFFVMSLPSVWRHNDVDPGPFGLEKLMTAVLLHEATHVVQSRTYGREIDALSKRFNLPDDFNDDSIQERFEDNAEFADSVARETALFFEAAASPEREQARTLASRARDLMRQRRNRWFVGDEHYLSEAEDLWLSLEGSGQWAGYRYLVAPDGGAVPMTDAMSGFGQRGKWWSQKLGLAMALTLDTLGYDWKTHAYGESTKTLSAMIDEALGQ